MASDLDHAVKVLKGMADYLLPYCKTKEDEADVAVLKQHVANVDGYELDLYYSREKHAHFDGDTGEETVYDLFVLQVYSKYFPFIPFSVLCKVAKKFLGDRELALCEFMLMGRKVYMWTVAIDPDGNPLPVPPYSNAKVCTYDGFTYVYAVPTSTSPMIS